MLDPRVCKRGPQVRRPDGRQRGHPIGHPLMNDHAPRIEPPHAMPDDVNLRMPTLREHPQDLPPKIPPPYLETSRKTDVSRMSLIPVPPQVAGNPPKVMQPIRPKPRQHPRHPRPTPQRMHEIIQPRNPMRQDNRTPSHKIRLTRFLTPHPILSCPTPPERRVAGKWGRVTFRASEKERVPIPPKKVLRARGCAPCPLPARPAGARRPSPTSVTSGGRALAKPGSGFILTSILCPTQRRPRTRSRRERTGRAAGGHRLIHVHHPRSRSLVDGGTPAWIESWKRTLLKS